jgi:hypothetical protein
MKQKNKLIPDPEKGEIGCLGCGLPVKPPQMYCNLCEEGEDGKERDREAAEEGKIPRDEII